VHVQPCGVRALDQQRERIDARGVVHASPRRRVGHRAVVPRATPAVDLHEQVGGAERARVGDEPGDPLRIVEHAARSLGQHPDRAMRRRRRGGRLGSDRARRLAVAAARTREREEQEGGNPAHGRKLPERAARDNAR
jgi:hypothetical protein